MSVRKKIKICDRFIYRLHCAYYEQYYIGMTENVIERLKQHRHSAHVGKKTLLCQAMRSYGIKNWKIKILVRIPDCNQSNALNIEQMLIKLFNPELNKAIRRVKTLGVKVYIREWHEKNRLSKSYRCDYCNLNCSSGKQLTDHVKTRKHRMNEERYILDEYSGF